MQQFIIKNNMIINYDKYHTMICTYTGEIYLQNIMRSGPDGQDSNSSTKMQEPGLCGVFAAEASLHGISKAANSQYNKLRRYL